MGRQTVGELRPVKGFTPCKVLSLMGRQTVGELRPIVVSPM